MNQPANKQATANPGKQTGKKASSYVSRQPDPQGYVDYPKEEHETWKILYQRQRKIIENRACDEFIEGLDLLSISDSEIPQLPAINKKLGQMTGWNVAAVPALIGFKEFFQLLANKKFPVATFIRRREDLDYLQEPDIFHEIFGHCPLLTNQSYADFSQHYGKLGLDASKQDRVMLARLYWFTIEFGLLNTAQGLRIYGGGILSSKEETIYALESQKPNRVALDLTSPVDALRTDYRIDELQKNYFIIDQLSDLQALIKIDLMALVEKARSMGMKKSDYS